MKVASFVKVATVNLFLVAVGLGVVELVFGSWFSDTHALYQFTKARNLRLEQANPFGSDPAQIVYTRDDNGFRGLKSGVDEIDILTVGGSTTDQRYLDDDATYQAVLASLFKREGRDVSIVNAGIDGQSTIGHIHNFASWFDRIEGLKTRYVLYYVGINDVLKFAPHETYDVVEVQTTRLKWQLYVREKSVLYQLYLIAKQHAAASPYAHGVSREHIVDPATAVDRGRVATFDVPQLQDNIDALRLRIAELDRLTRQMGASSIFVTQRSARWDRIDGRIVGIPAYGDESSEFRLLADVVNGVDIHHVEERVAEAIMAECKAADAICIDLFENIDFDVGKDFYDSVHTTSSGSRAIAKHLYDALHDRI